MGTGHSQVAREGLTRPADEYVDYSDSNPKYLMYKEDKAEIRFSKKGVAARPEDGGCPLTTVVETLALAATNWPDSAALRVERPLPPLKGRTAPPSGPIESWKTWTYKQYYEESRAAAMGFMVLGAQRFDGINILGFNSPEWFMSQLAAMMFGGKAAGIYPTDTPSQVQYKTALADGAVAVVDDQGAFDKFAKVVDDLPYLKAIVTWAVEGGPSELKRSDGTAVKVLTWAQLVALGRSEGDEEKLDEASAMVEPGHCAVLVFTSGTTGNPKAVMVSHDNLIFESYSVATRGIPILGSTPTEERIMSYLPLSHVAGMMVDIITPVLVTAYCKGWVCVHFARPYDLKAGTIGDRLRAIKPTMFLGVPRVWEKIAEKLRAVGASTKGLKKKLSTWAKAQSLAHQQSCLVGGSGERSWSLMVANVLLGKIHQALGLDECKFHFSGAAPLTRDTLEYFAALGININEVYGMSECTGATTWSSDSCHQWLSIGFEMDGAEVKVFKVDEETGAKTEVPAAKDFDTPTEEEQGEVCFRGRHVMMGYLCNPKLGDEHVLEMKKKNAETIDEEGWLHSGDKGSKDGRHMFRITGRYKEIIIGAGGENIAPVPIEAALKERCDILSNVVMVGDKRKFNVALVTLKAVGASGELPGTDELDGPAAALDPKVKTIPEAMKSKVFIETITAAITAVNKDPAVVVSNASKIQKFTILPTDLSVQGGEITPSLKLKRAVTQDKWSKIIDLMYESSEVYVPYPEDD